MNRSMLAAFLPLTLLACSTAASEETAASSDDITSIDDLGPLEQNLGLVKDPNRTRSEDVVKAGPCYQRMVANGRDWQLRRYTKGAAFFFTTAKGQPLDPIECVDVDVLHNERPQTFALSGLSLDIVQRFKLGAFTTSEVLLGPLGASYPVVFTFANGSIALRTGAYEETGEAPTYRGGQFSAAITGLHSTAFPDDRIGPDSSLRLAMPEVANLAYRIAKRDPRTPMAQDPVGHFVSIENTTPSAGDQISMLVHFEKVDVLWMASGAGDHSMEWLRMMDRATNEPLADCSRIVDVPGDAFECK